MFFQLIKKLETNSGKIKSLSFFNGQVWCCSWDMCIRLYEKTFEFAGDLKFQHTDAVSGVVFVLDNKRNKWMAWSCSYDKTICIWNIPENRGRKSLPRQ